MMMQWCSFYVRKKCDMYDGVAKTPKIGHPYKIVPETHSPPNAENIIRLQVYKNLGVEG